MSFVVPKLTPAAQRSRPPGMSFQAGVSAEEGNKAFHKRPSDVLVEIECSLCGAKSRTLIEPRTSRVFGGTLVSPALDVVSGEFQASCRRCRARTLHLLVGEVTEAGAAPEPEAPREKASQLPTATKSNYGANRPAEDE